MKAASFSLILLTATLALAAGEIASPAAAENSPVPMPAHALTRDLGRNLLYHRVYSLPRDLPAADPVRKQPRVVDVRYVSADAGAVTAFQTWLKTHASPRAPIFVLANADTDRRLIHALTARGAPGNVLVIGAAARNFAPDIAVHISPEDERRAYQALETDTDLTALLTDHPNKFRNDEASLSRDRSSEPPATPSETEAAKNSPAPPVDAALQRAVHLHRSLVALRRI